MVSSRHGFLLDFPRQNLLIPYRTIRCVWDAFWWRVINETGQSRLTAIFLLRTILVAILVLELLLVRLTGIKPVCQRFFRPPAIPIQRISWWAIEDSNLATSPHERDRISNHSKAYILVETACVQA